ncbi:MAG: hypothetical protein ACI86M_002322, partial [Saprospiraceae bacterium]
MSLSCIGLSQSNTFCMTNGSFPIEDIQQYSNSVNTNSYCLKTYIHVIRDGNSNGGVTNSQISTMFAQLESGFGPLGINFSWDNNVDYIDSDLYFNAQSTSQLSPLFDVSSPDGIDIFLLPETHYVQAGLADGVGDNTALLLSGKFWLGPNTPLLESKVPLHELGHVFGLNHTFHVGDCAELVDGSNCSNCSRCGDGFCDTAADPNMNYQVDPVTCTWTGSGTDSNGESYDPDGTNFMAYSNLGCMTNFSLEQVNFMKNRIASESYLQACLVNNSGGSCSCMSGDILVSTNTVINSNLDMDGD